MSTPIVSIENQKKSLNQMYTLLYESISKVDDSITLSAIVDQQVIRNFIDSANIINNHIEKHLNKLNS